LAGGDPVEAGRIEPLVDGPLIRRQRDVAGAAEKNGIAETECLTALVGVDALYLPSADGMGSHPVCRTAPVLAGTEGQFIHPRYDGAEGAVLIRDDVLRTGVDRIQVTDGFHELGPGERVRCIQTRGESFLGTRLQGVVPGRSAIAGFRYAAELGKRF